MFPWGGEVGPGWEVEAMTGVWLETGDPVVWSSLQVVNVECELSSQTAWFGEMAFLERETSQNFEFSPILGTGLLYLLQKNSQLDVALHVSIHGGFPSVSVTFGWSFRQ
ncbi:hypothetical protein MPNT_50001 [Candidatus Methylacidithermus pantelleriae]|uniref:Uncharacterized protein n=1 Tax=Candidatus Methylacidithermus pantelleriae TaxID=2744239 RepID=A0A8J2BK96_9BACT|nr:hypothetical protein MPNT_50001 [Candidatus Methylacidithermus pantelleriae]